MNTKVVNFLQSTNDPELAKKLFIHCLDNEEQEWIKIKVCGLTYQEMRRIIHELALSGSIQDSIDRINPSTFLAYWLLVCKIMSTEHFNEIIVRKCQDC